jgi:hypothetical protein
MSSSFRSGSGQSIKLAAIHSFQLPEGRSASLTSAMRESLTE